MGKKSYSLNRIKYWRCLDVDDVRRLFGIHEKTALAWFKQGLKPIDNRNPILVHGSELKAFLGKLNEANKCSGSLKTIFCMSCKEQKSPLQKQITIEQFEQKFLKVKAHCSGCKKPLHKSYKLDDLQPLKRIFNVVQVLELYDSETPTSNTPFFDQEKSSKKEPEKTLIQLELFL